MENYEYELQYQKEIDSLVFKEKVNSFTNFFVISNIILISVFSFYTGLLFCLTNRLGL